MSRKGRGRSRQRARRTKGRHTASSLMGFAWLARSGWGRFALGILIGIGLGVGTALYLGGPDLSPRRTGPVTVATLNATPVQKPIQKPVEVVKRPAAAPQVIEPATPLSKSYPEGEEANAAVAPPPATAPVHAAPAQTANIAPTPPITLEGEPTWLKNAVAFAVPPGRPTIAVVLDDVGVAPGHAALAIDLPAVVTLSFMTYAPGVADMAARAHAKGHELMLHVPMEPLDGDLDAGPHVLKVGASEAEILANLDWGLRRFPRYIGINNHMGSRFTQDERGMRIVLGELKRRSLLFLDSRTIGNTVGDSLAARMGVPHVMRDVFLDNEMDQAAVMKQLIQTEKVAAAKGHAIAIGHPHPATIAALRAWIPQAEARGFAIVPLSAVAKQRLGAAG
jgi:uncharacterized protein